MFEKKQNLPVKLEAFTWRLASLATCHLHAMSEANSNISLVTQLRCRAGTGSVNCCKKVSN